ncbi:MAG: phosphomannomutase/phosphoglucomutase [Candidatus Falkowbacteria bacterium]
MHINPNIFKAYDIRGVYEKDFGDYFAYQLGLAYIALRHNDSDVVGKKLQIVVGADMRLSSPSLKKALIEGLIAGGANVIDIGLCSTPTFYFAVANFSYDGGLMVSASHNPSEWNGFKMVRSKAVPISGDTGMEFLKEKIISGELKEASSQGTIIERYNVLSEQVRHDLLTVDLSKIKALKIVADTANGMGGQFLEALFNYLPCELIKMNFTLDGSFPAHEADPIKAENVADLEQMVLSEQADLGIAVDGDGDRVFFVDNLGRVIDQSIIRGILAKLFLQDKPAAKIGYDVRPGKITPDMIKKYGGEPMVTRVGHSLIKEQMIKENVYFAGESSGHFFLNMEMGCFEVPMIVILKLLTEFSDSNKGVAEQIEPYQKYFNSGEINSDVQNKDRIFHLLEEKYSDAEINKLDGITITYPDWWFNVRASNTENKMRLNLEAVRQGLMEEKRDEVLGIIRL